MAIIINTSGEQGVKIINGEIKNTVTVDNGKVVFENVQMNLPGRCINVLHDADVTLDKDCDIVATKDTPVFVNCDDGTHGPKLTVHGHVKATYQYTGANGSINPNTGVEAEDGEFAIAGNGTRGYAATEINIAEDAVVETVHGVALYQPQKGVLNIAGTVIGKTCVDAKAGTINVLPTAKLHATGSNGFIYAWGGSMSSGDCIMIEKMGYPAAEEQNGGPIVNIEAGAELVSDHGKAYEIYMSEKNDKTVRGVTLENANEEQKAVLEAFIASNVRA